MTFVAHIPGSKSLTIRALAAAALASGESRVTGALESEDTLAAAGMVQAFGASVDLRSEAWVVEGVAGDPPPGDVAFDVRESGLTARIAVALAALRAGRTIIEGRGRLPARPMSAILESLAPWDAEVRSAPGEWPIEIAGVGGRPNGGVLVVDVSASTQPVTALLLTAPLSRETLSIRARGLRGSWGYVGLTSDVVRAFGGRISELPDGFVVEPTGLLATEYEVEPDASAAVYPMVAAAITGEAIAIPGLGAASRQPDLEIAGHLSAMGCQVDLAANDVTVAGPGEPLDPLDADLSACPDGALAISVACLFAAGPSRLRGLHSLRFKESDRLSALASELTRVGATVEIDGDSLQISPGPLIPAQIETYNDHRMAMSFGVLSLVEPQVTVGNPDVVAKTWPRYWEFLDEVRQHLV